MSATMKVFVVSFALSIVLACLSRLLGPIGEEAISLSLAVGIELSGLLIWAFFRVRGLTPSVGIQWWAIQGSSDLVAFTLTLMVLSKAGMDGIFLGILLGLGVLAVHVTALVKVIRAIRRHHLANDKTACFMLVLQALVLVVAFLGE